jgi:hypothetical protein
LARQLETPQLKAKETPPVKALLQMPGKLRAMQPEGPHSQQPELVKLKVMAREGADTRSIRGSSPTLRLGSDLHPWAKV